MTDLSLLTTLPLGHPEKNPPVAKEPPSLQAYIHAATSQNTRRSYQADIRHFYAWGGYLPATTEMLLQYLNHYAASLNPKTLKRRLIAIKHWHTFQGIPDPTIHYGAPKNLDRN